MNVWTNSVDDIRLSLNDLYMVLLMTGWMFFFMGIYESHTHILLFGLTLVVLSFAAIRYQFLITQTQFLDGMIPHHSMAVFMSKRLLEKKNTVNSLLTNIIVSQEKEIEIMKRLT